MAVYRFEYAQLGYAGIVFQYTGNNEMLLAMSRLNGCPFAVQEFLGIYRVHDNTSIFERTRKFANLGDSRLHQ